MLNLLYGIDYNMYVCGGRANAKLYPAGSKTVLFDSEPEMQESLAKLKSDCHIGEIKPFTTIIKRDEYKFV